MDIIGKLIGRFRSKPIYREAADIFIAEVKEKYGIDLPYSLRGLALLDQLADQIKNASGIPAGSPTYVTEDEIIKGGMCAYVGEVLLDLCDGQWVKREVGPCVRLKNTSIGGNVEVCPAAWVGKRLKHGHQESIALKAVALRGIPSADWSPDWPQDRPLASAYAECLEVPPSDRSSIDEWVTSWLTLHKRTGGQGPGYDRVNADIVSRLPQLGQAAKKYLWGRVSKLCDGVNYTTFGYRHTCGSIEPAVEAVEKVLPSFTTREFLGLLTYLQDSPVGPNGNLFEHIWQTEKHSQFFQEASSGERSQAVIALLDLNARRGFHHSISDFKRILSLVRPDNDKVFDYLVHYEVSNRQGCYQAAEYIFGFRFAGTKTAYENFELQHQVILWLHNAIGQDPKKPWLDKLRKLEHSISPAELESICGWILAHQELATDKGSGWSDSIYRTFRKSAQWYLGGIEDNNA